MFKYYNKIQYYILIIPILLFSFLFSLILVYSYPYTFLFPLILLTIIFFILIFHKPFTGLLILTFLLPLERVGSLELSSYTIRPSQITLLILLIIIILKISNSKLKIKIYDPFIFIPFLCFLIISLLSLINAVNYTQGILIFLFIVFSASLAFILPILTNNLIKFKKIIIIFLLTTFFTCCFGIFQFIGDSFDLSTHITQLRPHYTKKILGFTRIQSTFIEPLYFGNFLILPLCLTTAFILNDKKNKKKNKTNNSKNKYNNNSYNNNNKYNDKTNKIICKKEKKSPLNTYKTLLNNKKSYYKLLPYLFNKYFLFILLFLIIINLILTSSRGAYIGALSGLFVILVFYRKKIFKLNKILMISCLIFISFIALNIFLNIYSSNFAQNTQTVFKKHIFNLFSGAAYVERIDTFKASLNLFSIHPYIGIGIGNFGPSISKDHLTKPKNGWPIVNNQILEILTETGIFGLFFILIFTLYILFKVLSILHKSQKLEIRIMALSLLAAFLGIIFQYQTFSTLYIMHIWFIIGLIISLDFIIKKNNSLNKTNK